MRARFEREANSLGQMAGSRVPCPGAGWLAGSRPVIRRPLNRRIRPCADEFSSLRGMPGGAAWLDTVWQKFLADPGGIFNSRALWSGLSAPGAPIVGPNCPLGVHLARERRRINVKRIILLAVVFGMISSGAALAADKTNVGCGIGTMIFEGKDGLLSQACAATTNGIFGNQTFGITSGTLDCAKPAAFTQNEQLDRFVGDNMDQLAMDISRGEGDYIMTLAALLDVPVEERAEFYALLQTNFSTIYPDSGVTHVDVLNNLETLLQS